MLLSADAPIAPDGLDSLMPQWAQQLSLISLLILVLAAFLRGWVVTRTQAEREIEAERRIAEVWKANFESSNELNEQLSQAFQPVLDSNAAILKAVESVQDRQARQEEREERERWLRDRRDT